MRTLVYLASGPYHRVYEDLPYERIILIDLHSRFAPINNSKVRCLRMNVLDALELLKREGIKIDCLVNMNEGIYEGGGTFAMLSDHMAGQLYPLLNDEFVLICNLSIYRELELKKIPKLDWGFDHKLLNSNDEQYIEPELFCNGFYDGDGNYAPFKKLGQVFKLTKTKNLNYSSKVHPSLKINVKHKSIWCDVEKLDAIGVSVQCGVPISDSSSTTVKEYILRKEKAFNLTGLSMVQILEHCEKNKIEHLGLMPWMRGAYAEAVEQIKSFKPSFLKSITFYHLGKNDLNPLKQLI